LCIVHVCDEIKKHNVGYILENPQIDDIEFHPQVIATDMNGTGLSNWVPLYIAIEDQNDNSPVFEQSSYQLDLPSYLDVGSVVTTLKAVDADGTVNANRVMYVLEQNGYGKFHVDFFTGLFRSCFPFSSSLEFICKFQATRTTVTPGMSSHRP
jgi:hypothetical protein